jgi:hypothetical protein
MDHPSLTQALKVQKVSPSEMEECRKQGLCYYCNEKYSPGHKCREYKFFHIYASTSYPFEDIPSYEAPDPDKAPPSDHVEAPVVTHVEPEESIISLHALSGILASQTLKIKGYRKHKPMVVLIDSGRTHNFIHHMLFDAVH